MTDSEMAEFKHALVAKQQDLDRSVARLEDEAREDIATDVKDPIDLVTSDEAKAGAFQTSSMERGLLKQVQAALDRLKDGSYGRCMICGSTIEKARLVAVPWTPYCLDDQEKIDKQARENADASGTLKNSTEA